ncbi:MAG: gephyrin-like molybdotransferase Glp [Pseudomonadota bacterium]
MKYAEAERLLEPSPIQLNRLRAKMAAPGWRAEKKPPVSLEEAQAIILNSVIPLGFEEIPIQETPNRVLYENIISETMIPARDDSLMDGYAVWAEDTLGATTGHPVRLEISGETRAGARKVGKMVSPGTAIRIMTGAPIPTGADAVVKIENAEEEGRYVKIFRETARYENYRFAGESINKGDELLRAGDRLSSADLGLMASLNYHSAKVYKQPAAAIISTGDELAEAGREIKVNQIRDANAYALCSEVRKYGGRPFYLGIARDALKDTREKFQKALRFDLVISTGGVSMGKYDFVKQNLINLDIDIKFNKVSVKPGSPVTFGAKGRTLFFGLPGKPVQVLTSFMQFVRPALLALMGAKRLNKPIVNAYLEEDVDRAPGNVHLLMGCFTIKNREFYVSINKAGSRSSIRHLRDANCLVIIPKNMTKIKAGEKVSIQLLDHNEI